MWQLGKLQSALPLTQAESKDPVSVILTLMHQQNRFLSLGATRSVGGCQTRIPGWSNRRVDWTNAVAFRCTWKCWRQKCKDIGGLVTSRRGPVSICQKAGDASEMYEHANNMCRCGGKIPGRTSSIREQAGKRSGHAGVMGVLPNEKPGCAGETPGCNRNAGLKPGSTSNHCRVIWKKIHLVCHWCSCAWEL